jgi:hypothetical protein
MSPLRSSVEVWNARGCGIGVAGMKLLDADAAAPDDAINKPATGIARSERNRFIAHHPQDARAQRPRDPNLIAEIIDPSTGS